MSSNRSDGRATGIGGIFFKVDDPAATREWYRRHLGLTTDDYGTSFEWHHADAPERKGFSLWSPFSRDSDYFDAPYMINLRVENLDALLARLRADGVRVLGEIETQDYGRFVHIEDGNGARIELWEPIDDAYDRMIGDARTR